ncbi:unnamed protein product, partial [Medioppia subpectinata]
GVSRNEGSYLSPKPDKQWSEAVFDELLANSQNQFHGLDLQAVKHYYLGRVANRSDPAAIRTAFYDYYGDVYITCPTYLFAQQLAKQSAPARSVYFYELTYQGDRVLGGCDPVTMGICHGSELSFVFGMDYMYSDKPLDKKFSKEVMDYWTSFAKTGVPTTEQKWPKLNDKSIIKDLNPYDFSKTLVQPFKETCDQFWTKYFE